MRRMMIALVVLVAALVAGQVALAAGKGQDKQKGKDAAPGRADDDDKHKGRDDDKPRGNAGQPADVSDGGRGRGHDRDVADEDDSDKDGGKGKKEKARNAARHWAQEEDKHRKRLANLDRVRDMLDAKGNEQAASRLELVIEKEHERHERVADRLGAEYPDETELFERALKRIAERARELIREHRR